MARITHRFEFPDRFVAGTVGQPGERTFFVQARQGSRLVSVVCEKQQVEVLADQLERVLDELSKLAMGGGPQIPPARSRARDLEPLDAPLSEEFRTGTMTIAWNEALDAIQVELYSVADEPDLDEPAESARFFDELAEVAGAAECLSATITPEQGRDFVARARALVHAGRPACPFCAQPINPDGHICPRSNGYRRPLFL